jgi:hypothetical protein
LAEPVDAGDRLAVALGGLTARSFEPGPATVARNRLVDDDDDAGSPVGAGRRCTFVASLAGKPWLAGAHCLVHPNVVAGSPVQAGVPLAIVNVPLAKGSLEPGAAAVAFGSLGVGFVDTNSLVRAGQGVASLGIDQLTVLAQISSADAAGSRFARGLSAGLTVVAAFSGGAECYENGTGGYLLSFLYAFLFSF